MAAIENSRMRDASFGSDRLDLLTRIELEERGERSGILSALLIPHPDDLDSEGVTSPRLLGGTEYVRENIHMAACFFTLLAGYATQRFACSFGLPDDCLKSITYLEFFSDITTLAFYSLALGWFIGIADPSRFSFIFSRAQGVPAAAVFLATPPLYSAVSNIPALKYDLTQLAEWSALFICVWGVVVGAVLTTLAWHVRAVWRRTSLPSFLIYTISRTCILLWFTISAYILGYEHHIHVHIHHYVLGFAVASFATENERVSVMTLALGAGIFIQGIGAYSFAPAFAGSGCFETPAASTVKCKFWSEEGSAFTLNVCGSGGVMPLHTCDDTL